MLVVRRGAKEKMRLRKKSLFVFGIICFFAIVIIYVLSEIILLQSFERLEREYITKESSRTRDAVTQELSFISQKISDWAAWDDTYHFIDNLNPAYITSNINSITFQGLKINFMVFVNASGKVVLVKAFDLMQEKEIPASELLLSRLQPGSSFLQQKNIFEATKGLVMLEAYPAFVVSRPIITSEGKGPPRGTLLFGRFLDEGEIKSLSTFTGCPLVMHRIDRSPAESELHNVIRRFSGDSPVFLKPTSSKTIIAYSLIKDIDGRPALIFETNLPRDIFRTGQITVRYLILSISLVGFIFMIVVVIFLDKFVLFRLASLSQSVSGIGESGGVSLRLSVKGKDEIASLAGEINGMLEKLEHARARLYESETQYQRLVENVNSIVLTMDRDCNITFWNRFAAEFFGYTAREIIGYSAIGTIVPETESGGRNLKQFMYQVCQDPQESSNSINENIKRNGERVWIAWTNRPITGKDNEIIGVLCVGNDITEYKKLEERLVSLNKVFLTLGSDFDKNIQQLTRTCGELLDATCALYNKISEGMLCSVGQWNTPEDYTPASSPEGHICYDLLRSKQKDILVVRNLDQSQYYVSDPNVVKYHLKTYIGCPVQAFGEVISTLCVVFQRDIEPTDHDKRLIGILASAIGIEEERRYSQDAIRRSRDFYLTLFDSFPTPVWRSNINGDRDYFNKAWLEFTGKRIEQELGYGWLDSVHPEDQKEAVQMYEEAAREQRSFEVEYRLKKKNGEYRAMIETGTPFYDLKGNFAGYIGSCYDVTERKHRHK
ncbi:MAG: PAS domain S-box protein [Candidatus Omnitrophota bacterium]|nr:MAG: PAS domain S-box protein [Candidatus Omnitrophota bacterium]